MPKVWLTACVIKRLVFAYVKRKICAFWAFKDVQSLQALLDNDVKDL